MNVNKVQAIIPIARNEEPEITVQSVTISKDQTQVIQAKASGITATHWLFLVAGVFIGTYLGFQLAK